MAGNICVEQFFTFLWACTKNVNHENFSEWAFDLEDGPVLLFPDHGTNFNRIFPLYSS